MPLLDIRGVSKSFNAKSAVLSEITLDVTRGEIVSLLGPSGCGKSTLLRIIAGLEHADAGTMLLEGTDLAPMAPRERNVAMVFQSLALYPHMTVGENIGLPLRVRNLSRWQRLTTPLRRIAPAAVMNGARANERKITAKVQDLADRLAIGDLLDRLPAKLSGGQRQRAAIGRALIRDCLLLLLDEPLSSLDAKLRVQAREEIVQIQRQFGLTCIFVTHDQADAFAISDRVAVMLGGRIAQIGTSSQIYRDPVSLDVARFVGTPTINCLTASVEAAGRVHAGALALEARVPAAIGEPVTLAIRPEHVCVDGGRRPGKGSFDVARVEDHGHDRVVHLHAVERPSMSLVARVGKELRIRRGDRVEASVALEDALVFGSDGRRLIPETLHLVEHAHG